MSELQIIESALERTTLAEECVKTDWQIHPFCFLPNLTNERR